jgi:hypothetical protein
MTNGDLSGIIVRGSSSLTIAFNAHFDGKVIVPEHAVDLPRDRSFVVHVETSGSVDPVGKDASLHALQWLAEMPWRTSCLAIFPRGTITTSTGRRSEADAASSLFRRRRFFGSRCSAAAAGIIMTRFSGKTFERVRHDPRIEVVPHSRESSDGAIRLFTLRSDKDWSLTDCLSFLVVERRNIRQALSK